MKTRVFRPCAASLLALLLCATPAAAQTPASGRLAILQTEDRRAPTPRDVAIIRGGLRSADPDTALAAVRALGRLERPALAGDIVPSLRHTLPEVRAAAADALGQAAAGWKAAPPAGAIASIVRSLDARLEIEADAQVRAAICETIGRLPYTTPPEIAAAQRTLLDQLTRHASIADRVGVAAGLEQLVRRQRKVHAPDADLVAALAGLAALRDNEATAGARVRRLALEALISANAVDGAVIARSMNDPDPQVRRLAIHAAATPKAEEAPASRDDAGLAKIVTAAMADDAAMVRLEAVRGLRNVMGDEACPLLVKALKDRDTHVDLSVLDQLAACGSSPDAVTALERTVGDLSQVGEPRGWHRAAHALVALAGASRDRASTALPTFVGSRVWQLRMYAARAATILEDRVTLDKLAVDEDDNVCEAALDGLVKVAGHAADARYVAALSRRGHQAQRAAALALSGTPSPGTAVPALKSALEQLVNQGFDNSHDARSAISATLAKLGAPVPAARRPAVEARSADLNADDLRRLASPRARVTISGVGIFDFALFTNDAPATVLRFAHLAETGYYNGLTFHRIVPNFVIQGGSPGANEYVGDSWFMRDELGLWPHVRGAVGISTRGRDTGDAQIFIDTVDNPRLDHEYTVFGQVLNGIEIVDRILEGDVIERIEIIP